MAVNNVIRMLNLTRGLNTDGDVDADSLADNFVSNNFVGDVFVSNNYFEDNKSSGPTITSIHPSANVFPGDTIYIDGTGFDRSANVMLISNTNVDYVVPRGSITFNNSANLTFSIPTGPNFVDEDYDVRVTVDNTGLAAVQLDALDFINTTGFQGRYFGYTSGGPAPGTGISNVIDKFPFASDANATDVGDLTSTLERAAGQSSLASGYTSGGARPGVPLSNEIGKFPFAADGNATDVGDLTVARYFAAGQSSDASGYTSGGYGPTDSNVIDKFPFASDGNATDVGDLTAGRAEVAGQSSTVSGYTTGGFVPAVGNQTIDKFPFASDANATDVGDLVGGGARYAAGQSSTVSGYSSGHDWSDIIQKFPFSSDTNATDVGDLTLVRKEAAGHQI